MFAHFMKWTVVMEVDILQGVYNKSPIEWTGLESGRRLSVWPIPTRCYSTMRKWALREASSLVFNTFFQDPDHLEKGLNIGEAPCHPRCPMRFQLPLNSRKTDLFAPFIAPVTAPRLQGQQLRCQRSGFLVELQHGTTHCQLGETFPVISLEPWPFEGLHVAAQGKLDEKAAITLSFLQTFGARSPSLFQSSGLSSASAFE